MATSRHACIAVLASTLLILAVTVSGSASAGTRHRAVVTENPANVTPNVIDDAVVAHTAIHAFAQVGDTMYAGGTFRSVARAGQTTRAYTRYNIMSFNASTGAMTSFAPNINGPVWAIQSSGSSLYVAGAFTHVNGVARRGVVKLNPTTGAVDRAFNAGLRRGNVNDMHISGRRLVIGGSFPKVLMALNLTKGANTGYIDIPITGTLAKNAGATDVYRFSIDPAGSRLVAIGNFTTVSGRARSRAFMLNLGRTSASLNRWYYEHLKNPCRSDRMPAYLRGVDFSPNGRYFVLVSTGFIPRAGGENRDICDAAAKFSTTIKRPARPVWINYTNGDTLHSVVVTGAAVYVQGHMRWLDNGAVAREGIGAIGPTSGRALRWNPGKTRAVGGKVLYATSAGLWVGSDGARFAGERRDNIAFCPLL